MATSDSRSRPRKRSRLLAAVIAGSALLVAVIVAVVVISLQSQGPQPPSAGTVVLASAQSKAADAAASADGTDADRASATFLSAQPTAVWLVPETDPIDTVRERVASLADEAREQDARLALVVYGLPGRDCGSHSAGGLEPGAYAEWTTAIGEALRDESDVAPIVVLEPDSLALAPECANLDERAEQLTAAVAALSSENTWIYLDGGHSNWHSADDMADLIGTVGGLDSVRGFATNVSNYNGTDDEVAYAHALSGRLDGMHALIDTSRNGGAAGGEWCNPPMSRVGEAGGSIGDDVVDTNLWIKPPGESDGPCNGGPAAGRWWPAGAVELTRDVVPD